MTTDITDVLRACGLHQKDSTSPAIVTALAAAAADGPLVEDVECSTCRGEALLQYACDDCVGRGFVRIVVHRADPALAERLRGDPDCIHWDTLDAAARIIGGEQ